MAMDLDALVDRCRGALAEHTPTLAVRDVLEELVADPSDLAAAVGPMERGGIVPLHHAPDLTIIHVTWMPGIVLNPHEHNMWAAIAMYGGQEDNAFYRRVPGGLEPSGGRELPAGEVLLLGDDTIHSVANSRREHALAVHVYGGDFFAAERSEWDWDTWAERPRDMERTHRLFAEAEERWAAEGG